MANLQMKNILLQGRRAYTAATETIRTVKAKDVKAEALPEKKEAFWMRDPKTGNWIPETHFGEVDVVELRKKFLSEKVSP